MYLHPTRIRQSRRVIDHFVCLMAHELEFRRFTPLNFKLLLPTRHAGVIALIFLESARQDAFARYAPRSSHTGCECNDGVDGLC